MKPDKNTPREKLNLTKEQGKCIIFGDLEGFKLIHDNVVDNSRWSIHHDVVVQRESDNKFFRGWYSTGATECQYEAPFDDDEPNFKEVFPIEKVVVDYV